MGGPISVLARRGDAGREGQVLSRGLSSDAAGHHVNTSPAFPRRVAQVAAQFDGTRVRDRGTLAQVGCALNPRLLRSNGLRVVGVQAAAPRVRSADRPARGSGLFARFAGEKGGSGRAYRRLARYDHRSHADARPADLGLAMEQTARDSFPPPTRREALPSRTHRAAWRW